MKEMYMKQGETMRTVAKAFDVHMKTVRNVVYPLMSTREMEAKKNEIRRMHTKFLTGREVTQKQLDSWRVPEAHRDPNRTILMADVPKLNGGRLSMPVPGESLLKFVVKEE